MCGLYFELYSQFFHSFFSEAKLDDPTFSRRNHAALCFMRLDSSRQGVVTSDQFRMLYAMLQQNEVIGYKGRLETALVKLDPEQEQLVRFDVFLDWVSLVSRSPLPISGYTV